MTRSSSPRGCGDSQNRHDGEAPLAFQQPQAAPRVVRDAPLLRERYIKLRRMELFQVDNDGRLFISPAIDNWDAVAHYQIDTVIDLEGELDTCIPTCTNSCLYIYFPIDDDNEKLPNMIKLRAIARLGASLIAEGHRVLSHCGMGYNRSAFVAGLIMIELGMPGPEVVARLRERRPGALFNEGFADFLASFKSSAPLST